MNENLAYVGGHSRHDLAASGRRPGRSRLIPVRRRVDALDGIRALAIIAIVIYHANATWLPGGFLGVTVFFVLTGYLITDGILGQISLGGTFKFKEFYLKRVKRLVPTMLIVIAVVALLCTMFAPQLFEKLRPDAVPSALFYDNWWYIFRQQSYFEAAGQPSPLTHYWYLAVVGQFYLVWPLVMCALRKATHKKSTMRRIVAGIGIASLVLMVVMFVPDSDPSRVYYGTDTRLAELMVGAWTAFVCPLTTFKRSTPEGSPVQDSKPSTLSGSRGVLVEAAGFAALALLVVMCFQLNGYSEVLFRGGLFVAAALSAVLVVSVVKRDGSWVLSKILGCKPMRVIGARSFALYMWHYPLLLIMNPATRTTALPWWGWVLEIIVIVGLSELSYRLVEGVLTRNLFPSKSAGKQDSRGAGTHRIAASVFGVAVVVFAAVLIVAGPAWGAIGQSTESSNDTAQEQPATPLGDEFFAKAFSTFSDKTHPIAVAIFQNVDNLVNKKSPYTYDPTTGATDAPVLMIGDSIGYDVEDDFYQTFPLGYIDCKVSRQLGKGPEIYQDIISQGLIDPEVVVWELGSNGVARDWQVRDLIEVCGDKQVYLINLRTPDPLQDMNNELFAQIAAEYPNAHVIDWYGTSTGHDDWLVADGTHLQTTGFKPYVEMIRKAVVGY